MSALHKRLRHSSNVRGSLKKGAVGGGPEHSGVLNIVLKGDEVWNISWSQLGAAICAHVRVEAQLRGGQGGGQTPKECCIARVLTIVSRQRVRLLLRTAGFLGESCQRCRRMAQKRPNWMLENAGKSANRFTGVILSGAVVCLCLAHQIKKVTTGVHVTSVARLLVTGYFCFSLLQRLRNVRAMTWKKMATWRNTSTSSAIKTSSSRSAFSFPSSSIQR